MFRAMLIQLVASTLFQVQRMLWFVTRPNTFGVQAVPITPAGAVILVRLTYRTGWHLPGGGRLRNEPEREAILRELREEIGLQAWESCRTIERTFEQVDWKTDSGIIFLIEGVTYRPRYPFEIAEVAEFDPAKLPSQLSSNAAAVIKRAIHCRSAASD